MISRMHPGVLHTSIVCLALSALVYANGAHAQLRSADDYLFLIGTSGKVSNQSLVAGNIGINAPDGRLNIAKSAVIADGTQVVAGRLSLSTSSRVFDVFANDLRLHPTAVVAGTLTQPVPSPVYDPEPLVVPDPFDPANLPPDFPVNCGGSSPTGGQRETFALNPGTYDRVRVGRAGKVLLGPGTYNFCSLSAIKNAGIHITGPATINIRDAFPLGSSSSVVPFGNPNQIQINVEGRLARIGQSSTFNARLFAPNGFLRLGRSALVTGHFAARVLKNDKNVTAFTCGNGRVDPNEHCDTSAPNGDLACPGLCRPPGSPDECTCPASPPTTTTTAPVTTTTSTTEPSTTSSTATITTTSTTTTSTTTTSTTTTSTTTTSEPPTTTTSTTSTTSTTESTTTTTSTSSTTTSEPPTTTSAPSTTATSTTEPSTTTSSTSTTLAPSTTTTSTTTTTTTTSTTTTSTTTTSTTTTSTTTTSTTTTSTTTTTSSTTSTSSSTTTTAPPVTTTTSTTTTTLPPTTTTSTSTTTTSFAGTTTTLPLCVSQPSVISSNFNGTPIRSGNYIWFNSILKVSGLGAGPVTVRFDAVKVEFSAAGVDYSLTVPSAQVTFDPNATLATTSFNVMTNTWETTTPPDLSGNTFLTALRFQAPIDLPGGINPVVWSGKFSSSTPGIGIQWKWAAAVYTALSADNNALGVKPVDDNQGSIYMNSHHAGTPENFTDFVIGGARGGGGSNFTGSYSGTASVACP